MTKAAESSSNSTVVHAKHHGMVGDTNARTSLVKLTAIRSYAPLAAPKWHLVRHLHSHFHRLRVHPDLGSERQTNQLGSRAGGHALRAQ